MNRIGTDKGFTLLELAVAMAGLALLTASSIPFFIRQAEIAAAQKTVKEVSTVQEAAKWYYLANFNWPNSFQALQAARLLNPQWAGINPWGYAYSVSSTLTTFTVATTVPNTTAGVLTRALPGAGLSGSGGERTVASVISAPGYEASLDEVRNAATAALNMARESAVPPFGPMTEMGGRGYIPPCPSGYIVVGTHAGGGTNAAGVHCQRVTRSGASSNEAIAALQRQIAQLESEYQQLIAQNQQLQMAYQSLLAEYQAFQEWLDQRRDNND